MRYDALIERRGRHMDLLNLTKIAAMTEAECRMAFEEYRWPSGVRCPRCDEMAAISPMGGKRAGKGWYRCNTCNREGRLSQFTVKVGTVMEDSPIKFKVWLMAWCMEVSSKKGYSSHQMARNLGVTQKTAWFMLHRIREACGNDLAEFFKRNSPALRREIDAVLKALLTPEAG